MRNKRVRFSVTQVELMATFIGTLIREGIEFETESYGADGWDVILTGGY